jgi:hypothetical protein
MLHPSPIPPSLQKLELPPRQLKEQKQPRVTRKRPRLGETRGARIIKAILRPPIKLFYYIISWIRGHKLTTLGLVLLFLASGTLTNYEVTGEWPLGIGVDQFNFHIKGGDGGGDKVKDWLYALRDGDVATMNLLESTLIMAQPPDPSQLVSQFSEKQTNLVWQDIHVVGVYQQSDTTVDSLVSITLAARGPGGGTKGFLLWHFTTVAQNGGVLLTIDLVNFRNSLL